MIVTQCRWCVFAEYSNDQPTERACKLDRVERFEEQGKVVGVENQDGQPNPKFLQINALCNACTLESNPILKGVPRSKWKETVLSHVGVRLSFIIRAYSGTTESDIRVSLDSIASQSIEPASVLVVLDGSSVDLPTTYSLLQKYNFKWEIVVVGEYEESDSYAYPSPGLRALDIAVGKLDPKQTQFYTTADSGYEWNADFIENLNNLINYEMKPVIYLKGDEKGGEVITLILHKHDDVCGNVAEPIGQKLSRIYHA